MLASKPMDKISIDELRKYGVWEYDLDERNYSSDQDETWVYAVQKLPVDTLENRIVAVDVTLANGRIITATLENIIVNDPVATKEFLAATFWINEKWVFLLRYFDVAYSIFGPKALCKELGMSIDEVFPIKYDITNLAIGAKDALKNVITSEPERILTDKERSKL